MKRCSGAGSSASLRLGIFSSSELYAVRFQRGGRGGGGRGRGRERARGRPSLLPQKFNFEGPRARESGADNERDLLHFADDSSFLRDAQQKHPTRASPRSFQPGDDIMSSVIENTAPQRQFTPNHDIGVHRVHVEVPLASHRVKEGTAVDRLQRKEVDRILLKNADRKEELELGVARERLVPELPRILCDEIMPLSSFNGLWVAAPMGSAEATAMGAAGLKPAPPTPEYLIKFLAGGDGAPCGAIEAVRGGLEGRMRELEDIYGQHPSKEFIGDGRFYFQAGSTRPSRYVWSYVERLPLPQPDLVKLMEILCRLRGVEFVMPSGDAGAPPPLSLLSIERFVKTEWQQGNLESDIEMFGKGNHRLREPAYMFTLTTNSFGWKKARTFLASRFATSQNNFYFLGKGSGNNGLTSVVVARSGCVSREQLLLLNVMTQAGDVIRIGNITEVPGTLFEPPEPLKPQGPRVPFYDLTSGSVPLVDGRRLLTESLLTNVLLGSKAPLPPNVLLPADAESLKKGELAARLPEENPVEGGTITVNESHHQEEPGGNEGASDTASSPLPMSMTIRRLAEDLGVPYLPQAFLYQSQVCLRNVVGSREQIEAALGALSELGAAGYYRLANWELGCAKGLVAGDMERAFWSAVEGLVPVELRNLVSTITKDVRGFRKLFHKLPPAGVLKQCGALYINGGGSATQAVEKLCEYMSGQRVEEVLRKHIFNLLISARIRQGRKVLVGDFVKVYRSGDESDLVSEEEANSNDDEVGDNRTVRRILADSVQLVRSVEEAERHSFEDVFIPMRSPCTSAETSGEHFKGSFAPGSLLATIHDGFTTINTKGFVAQLLVSEGLAQVFSTDRIPDSKSRELVQKRSAAATLQGGSPSPSLAALSYFPVVTVPRMEWKVLDDTVGARSPDGSVTYVPPGAARGFQSLESPAVAPLSSIGKALAAANSPSKANLRIISPAQAVEQLRRNGLSCAVRIPSSPPHSSPKVGVDNHTSSHLVTPGEVLPGAEIFGLVPVSPVDPDWLRAECCVSSSPLRSRSEANQQRDVADSQDSHSAIGDDDDGGLFSQALVAALSNAAEDEDVAGNALSLPNSREGSRGAHVVFGHVEGVEGRHFQELTPLTKPSKLDDISKQYTVYVSCISGEIGSSLGGLGEYFTLSPITDPRSLQTLKMLRLNSSSLQQGILVDHFVYHTLLRPSKRWVSQMQTRLSTREANPLQPCDKDMLDAIATCCRERLSHVRVQPSSRNHTSVSSSWVNEHVGNNVGRILRVSVGDDIDAPLVGAVDELLMNLLSSLGGASGDEVDNEVAPVGFSRDSLSAVLRRVRPQYHTKQDQFCDICFLPHDNSACPNFQFLKSKKRDANKRAKGILPSLPGDLVLMGTKPFTASGHVSLLGRGTTNYEQWSVSEEAILAGYSQRADQPLLQKWISIAEPRPYEFRLVLRSVSQREEASTTLIDGARTLNVSGCIFQGFVRRFTGHIGIQGRPIMANPKGEVRPFGYFHGFVFNAFFPYVQPGRDSIDDPDALVVVAVNGVAVKSPRELQHLLSGGLRDGKERVPGWDAEAESEVSGGSVLCVTLWPQRYANAFETFNGWIATAATSPTQPEASAEPPLKSAPTTAAPSVTNPAGGGGAFSASVGSSDPPPPSFASATSSLLPGVASTIMKLSVARASPTSKWGIRLAGLRFLPLKSAPAEGTQYTTSETSVQEQLLDFHSGLGVGFVDAPVQPPGYQQHPNSKNDGRPATSSQKVFLTDKVFLVRGINGFRTNQGDISTILGSISSGGGMSAPVLRLSLTLQRISLPSFTVTMSPPPAHERDSKIGLLISTASGVVGRPPRGSLFHSAIQQQAPLWCNLRHDYVSLGTHLGHTKASALEREYEDDDEKGGAEVSGRGVVGHGGSGPSKTEALESLRQLCALLSDPADTSPSVDDASFRVLAVNGVENFSPADLKSLMRDFKEGRSALELKLGMLVRAIPKHVPQN